MSGWLIGAVTVAYIGVSVSEAIKGNYGMALVFAGYSFANIGLIMSL